MRKFFKHVNLMFSFVWNNSKIWVFLTTLQNISIAAISIVTVIAPKYIIDELLTQKKLDALALIVVLYAGIVFLCTQLNHYLSLRLGIQKDKLTQQFDIMMCRMTAEIDFKYLESSEYLDLRDRAGKNDFSAYCSVLESFFAIVRYALVIVSVSSIIVTLSPFIIGLIAVVVLLNGIANSRNNKNAYKFQTLLIPIDRKIFHLTGLLSDFTYGKETRIYSMNPFIMKKFRETAKEAVNVLDQWLSYSNRSSYLRYFTAFVQLLAIYGYLAFEVVKKGLSIGNFTMCFSAINELSVSLDGIVSEVQKVAKMGLHIDDLEKFISLASKTETDNCATACKEERYVFEFVDVSFQYPGSENFALENINIKIDFTEKLSIVGLNGAGKTTFIKLLSRLYEPTSGSILLNGVNILTINLLEYRRLFSVVFQDFKMFALSLKENICLSNEEVLTALDSAIEKSGLRDKIELLPDGVNTAIYKIFDESGIEPSGGEGQKIAIARAIYRNTPIVILDEPTAALDPIAEYEIYQKFDHLVHNKTAIYISHRLSSTRFCDKIAVFEGGKIVEYGTHKELMENHALYFEMYSKQADFYVNSKAVQ